MELTTLLGFLGVLGVGGYLVYRHIKKNNSYSSSDVAFKNPTLDQNEGQMSSGTSNPYAVVNTYEDQKDASVNVENQKAVSVNADNQNQTTTKTKEKKVSSKKKPAVGEKPAKARKPRKQKQ